VNGARAIHEDIPRGNTMQLIKALVFVAFSIALISCQITSNASAQLMTQKQAVPSASRFTSNLTFLHTEGDRILNDSGGEVRLRGVNIGSWLLVEPWIIGVEGKNENKTEKEIWDLMGRRFGEEQKLNLIRTFRENWFTEEDVRRISESGMNCVRLPIWWQAVNGTEYDGNLTYVNNCIEWCKKYGLYVILDLHGAPGSQNNQSHTGEPTKGSLWRNDTFKKESVGWWQMMAQEYKNEPVVAGYDLLNEPEANNFNAMISLYDRMYSAIRGIDKKHIIVLEAGMWSQDLYQMPLPKDKGWTNVVYSFHYYPQNLSDAENATQSYFPLLRRTAMPFGVPIYVGEFNTIQKDRGGVDLFKRYCDIFDYYGWSWTFWTFKKIEENHNNNWGLYGYVDKAPTPNFTNDSLQTIETSFKSMRTEHTSFKNELKTALIAPSV
jgi:hypothetical protein